jgi:hypothetical protein
MEMKRIPLIAVFLSLITASFACETQGKRCVLRSTVSYSNKGTRSESRHGYLFLNGKKIPDVYRLVICNDRAFKFFQRRHMWGRDGYFPVKTGVDDEIVKGSTDTGSDAIERGYYRGNVRYENTPESWIFIKWDGGKAFVSPERIADLDGVLRLRAIPRVIRKAGYGVPLKMDGLRKRDR